jgi:hypothetical protein
MTFDGQDGRGVRLCQDELELTLEVGGLKVDLNSGELIAATTLCRMFLVMARDKEFRAGDMIGVNHSLC